MYDTMAIAERLEVAGVEQMAAKAIAKEFAGNSEYTSERLATKEDIGGVRREIAAAKEDIAGVKEEIRRLEKSTDEKLARLEKSTNEKLAIVRWMIGLSMTLNVASIAGIIALLLR